MKTIALIISMMTLVTFNSLGQETDIKGLLEKPKTRTEIFNTIMNSHELMTDFMKAANGNEHASMMMRQNSRMSENNGNMGMNGGNSMMAQNGNMGMQNGNTMMGNNGNMGMYNQYPMMNYNTMMNMWSTHPEVMSEMMGNMMKIGEQNTDLGNNMSSIMMQHPAMMQMLMNDMRNNGMIGKKGTIKPMHSNGNMGMNNNDSQNN